MTQHRVEVALLPAGVPGSVCAGKTVRCAPLSDPGLAAQRRLNLSPPTYDQSIERLHSIDELDTSLADDGETALRRSHSAPPLRSSGVRQRSVVLT